MNTSRQQALIELIRTEPLSDQKQIVQRLKERYGIETNQTVVSRDLRKLGVVKKQIKGDLLYELPQVDVNAEILRLALIDITHNEAMIVIKTHTALADFVGDCLDALGDELQILGCLAGENVVFVAPSSIQAIETTYKAICEKLHFKK